MTPSERITALESLLARVQKNAALPRRSRRSEAAPANAPLLPARPRLSTMLQAQSPSAGRYAFTPEESDTSAPPLVPAPPRTSPPPAPRRTSPPPAPLERQSRPPALNSEDREEILGLDDLDVVFDEEEAALAGHKARASHAASKRAEQEHLARVAAERSAGKTGRLTLAREAAEREERDRLARETTELAELEWLTRETAKLAEQKRLAREADEGAEQERRAREESEKTEQERMAREASGKAEAEPAPASARQPKPKHELLGEGEAFTDLDEEEAPPESGEVASQRKPASDKDGVAVALDGWDGEHAASAPRRVSTLARITPSGALEAPATLLELRIAPEPAPPPAAVPGSLGPVAPVLVVEISAEITRRALLRGDATVFVEAARAPGPPTFGELLDAALALGEE